MFTTNIRKWGNSQGLYIPKDLLRQLKIAVNDPVSLSVEDDAIVIKRSEGSSIKQKAIDSLKSIREQALTARSQSSTGSKSQKNNSTDYRKEYEEYLDERYGE